MTSRPHAHVLFRRAILGVGIVAFCVILDSGQSVHIWLEGVTENEPPPRPNPQRLVLQPAEQELS